MLSAERRFEIVRSLNDVSALAHIRLPGAGDIEPGRGTPQVFGARDQSVHDLVPGDTFTTSTGIVGVVTPIEWTIVEKTTRSDLIATRRGRYHVVSRGLLGATATVVLNIYERESSVIAELFVLVDELILAGDLQHSFETAIDHQIDSLIASARKRFRVLRDMTELPTT